MPTDVQTSQHEIMHKAAETANKMMRRELASPDSPIRQAFLFTEGWDQSWNPFRPDWNAHSGFGLKLRPSDAVAMSSDAAHARAQEIATRAIFDEMNDRPSVWVGPLLNDLFSETSFYQKLVISE